MKNEKTREKTGTGADVEAQGTNRAKQLPREKTR